MPPNSLLHNELTLSTPDKPHLNIKVKTQRRRWTEEEMEEVLCYFGRKILQKEMPVRSDIVKFMAEKGHLLKERTIAQVLLFVRNHVERKQLNVTPKVKKYLKL